MNTLPALFEERMRKLLPEESEAFFAALQTEPPVSIRLNPGKPVPISRLFPDEQIGLPVSWCESAYYLKSRPVFTLDPCLHSGTYYVQEASSMFLYHIRTNTTGSSGKSIGSVCRSRWQIYPDRFPAFLRQPFGS